MSRTDLWMTVVAVVLGVIFGALRLVRRYPVRYKYAFLCPWGRGLVIVSAIFTGFVHLIVRPTCLRLVREDLPTSLLLAVSSGLFFVGISTILPVEIRKQSGTRVLVTASSWIYEILECEIDKVVAQKVTETALKIEVDSVSAEALLHIGNYLILTKPPSKKRSAQLARIDALARDGNIAGLIAALLDHCEPEWLARVARQQPQKPPQSSRKAAEFGI